MTTLTKSNSTVQQRYEDENLRITCPIYVGVSHDCARRIMETLRSRITAPTRQEGSLQVQTQGMTDAQRGMEDRLRINFFTLRQVLFSSMQQGVSLDLALRLQAELGDEFEFITDKIIKQSLDISLKRYKHYAETHKR